MTNIINLTVPSRILPLEARIPALVQLFAEHRRTGDDVFWLKENAELLNILECTGIPVGPEALAPHAEFYVGIEKRLQFFPQYYRFLLSMALDLEDLGMPGTVAESMVHFAQARGLARAEMSDLQRAEARRLMARRGVDPVGDDGLNDRLRAFADRCATFALPNKKAAYELTHIVFYLSEYGRKDPDLPDTARQSLHFAGLTAYLDQNADLLAEICIALIHSGDTPPDTWTEWLSLETARFGSDTGEHFPLNDEYHTFFVCNWHAATLGNDPFRTPVSARRTRFERGAKMVSALREISQSLMMMEGRRSGDYDLMRRRMAPDLSPETSEVLQKASQSSECFDAYFEGFARAGRS